MKQRKTQDQVMQFLCDLNDRYSHVKSNILMMNPLPVMNLKYKRLFLVFGVLFKKWHYEDILFFGVHFS